MPVMVLSFVLGVSLFVYGWLLAITAERRNALYAIIAVIGLAICIVSGVVAQGQHLVTY